MDNKDRAPSPWESGMPHPGRPYAAAEVLAPWEKGAKYEDMSSKEWFLQLRDELSKKTLDDLNNAVGAALHAGYIAQNQAFPLKRTISKLQELMGYST